MHDPVKEDILASQNCPVCGLLYRRSRLLTHGCAPGQALPANTPGERPPTEVSGEEAVPWTLP